MRWLLVCLLAGSGVWAGSVSGNQTKNPFFKDREPLALPEHKNEVFPWFREYMMRLAEESGVKIVSMNVRKERIVDEASGLVELNLYFGYSSDYASLSYLLASLEQPDEAFNVNHLTISRQARKQYTELARPGFLNGNAIVSLYWRDNQLVSPRESDRNKLFPGEVVQILEDLAERPRSSRLTHIQIKNAATLTVQGESPDLDNELQRLVNKAWFTNPQPNGSTYTGVSKEGNYRFMFRGTINF